MSNEYKTFAAGSGANAMTSSAWAALTTLLSLGFQPGVASSEQINTVLRQLSVAVSGLAELGSFYGQTMLDDGDRDAFKTRLDAAIRALSDAQAVDTARREITPPGMLGHFWRTSAPSGWIECAGQTLLRASYPDLYAAIAGTVAAPSPSTFVMPDLRGKFFRAWDHGAGVDSGRAAFSLQSDAMQRIQGAFGVDDRVYSEIGSDPSNAFFAAPITSGSDTTAGGGDGLHRQLGFDSARVTRTASETRPVNVAVLVCMKY